MNRAAGTLTILRHWPGQRRVHFLPREQLTSRRDARVRETLAYAAEHVPYYRDLFREGLDRREIESAEGLRRLPLISKEDVRAQPDAFRSTSPRMRDGVVLRSSGTTGSPLDLFHDRASVLANIAYAERERMVEASLCGKRYGYTGVFLDTSVKGGNLHRVRDLGRRASYRPLAPKLIAVPTEGRVEEVVEAINRIRPDVLRGTGAYIETLFRALGSPPPGMHRAAAISYSWDGMTAEGRRFVEEVFGIPVLSHYSSMEAMKIGFFCEERNGFHLHEDLCHVELVSADGEAVPAGEPGEVVISNLVNHGTVLLRYRLGDVARLALEPCPCGRTSRRLVDLEGRLSEVIRLPDGALVHSRGIGSVVNQLAGVVRFQLVQRGPTSFELRLATVDRQVFDRGAPQAIAGLRALLPGCEIEASYETEIRLEPGEKYRPVVLQDPAPSWTLDR